MDRVGGVAQVCLPSKFKALSSTKKKKKKKKSRTTKSDLKIDIFFQRRKKRCLFENQLNFGEKACILNSKKVGIKFLVVYPYHS
jgi:hypothetical protein